ncbi:MAG: 16S rRNA (cytidine(1402)-2'-O)-methyltransferase [Alphaproteobacteria bacterium]|nr:16S rRNA (cytidine(1402)-2'-O)-methyltransferase [Alphaproteobacteria bacterium]
MTNKPESHTRRYVIGSASFEADSLAPGLYIVATPIGNLGDITIRALATMAAADAILCEDTRTTAKLLARFGMRVPLAPYHEHNAAKVRPGILARLRDGARIALVSDAGMPLVSDPGYRLVREAVDEGIAVTACPGPSSVLAGLALSGLPTDRFAFFGFVPQKAGDRRHLFAEMEGLRATLILFESPHRIAGTLAEIAAAFPGCEVAVARELTKIHEEVLRGSAADVAARLAERPAVKGEITLLIGPPPDTPPAPEQAEVVAAIRDALEAMSASNAAAEISRRFGLAKKQVYAQILAMKDAGDGSP